MNLGHSFQHPSRRRFRKSYCVAPCEWIWGKCLTSIEAAPYVGRELFHLRWRTADEERRLIALLALHLRAKSYGMFSRRAAIAER